VTNEDGSKTQYTLASLGIVTSSDWTENGKLHIMGDDDDPTYAMETNKLKAAIEGKPEIFSKIFADGDNGSDGIGKQIYDYMMKAMKKTTTSSSLTFYDDVSMKEDMDDYDDKIDELNQKLSDLEDRYYDQFAKMESAMAKLQQQQSYLASLMGTA
ncbi:MAG: flagellar filament capping protein FliD, partial [Lachnospiraceae bacterium]|nr:flagellar filament capping protein FliD [Lachnospiraceae bacterium]